MTVAIAGWSYNTSRDLHHYILPDNVTAIIPQVDLCSSPDLFLLVIVCSSVANFKQRAAIRETWASAPSITNSSNTVKVAFLLGDPDNSTLQVLASFCFIILNVFTHYTWKQQKVIINK